MGDSGGGQILVISALMLAVLFVGLALILNGAIYAENVASRQTTSTGDPVAMAEETEDRLQRAAEAANWNDDDLPYSDRRSMVEDSVGTWDRQLGSDGARRGVAVSGRLEGTTEGVRVSQRDPGDFMPADEDLDQYLLDQTIDPLGLGDRTNWLVAPDVNTRSLKVGVNRTDLEDIDEGYLDTFENWLDTLLDGSTAFWIQIQDGSTTWRVYLFDVQNEDEVATVVTSDDGDETVEGVCQVRGEWVTLDTSDGVLRGDETTDCPVLSFYDDLDSHNMYWVGADEVNGTYHFIADKPETQFRSDLQNEYESIIDSLDVGALFPILGLPDLLDDLTADNLLGENGSPQPFTTSAVYDVTLSFSYDAGDVQYERNITATGG